MVTESVSGLLCDRCARQERKRGVELDGIKGPIAEEIEIHGLPVAQMQGEGGSTIEHEFAGHRPKLVP